MHGELASASTRLRDRFADACVALGLERAAPPQSFQPDASFVDGDDPARVFRDLERFEPCGQANRAPLLELTRARVVGTRVMKERHLAVDIQLGRGQIRAFGYDLAAKNPAPGSHVRIVGRLRRDDYRGNGAVEMRMETLDDPA